jgi:hypothetical protein
LEYYYDGKIYSYANEYILVRQAEAVDIRIRRLINMFVKG